MKVFANFSVSLLCVLSVSQAFAGSDFLAEQTVQIQSTRSGDVLNRTVADPKAVFERYQPALDSSSKIVRPVRVSGPNNKPVMEVSIKKCVGFICQTVDLDAVVTIREGRRAGCDRIFMLQADLARSSQQVRDVYDRLDAKMCYNASTDGKGTLLLSASAHHGPSYSQGFTQKELFKMLKMQVAPIIKALQETLKDKEKP